MNRSNNLTMMVFLVALLPGLEIFAIDGDESVTDGPTTVQQRSLEAEVVEPRDLTRGEVFEFYAGESELEYSDWADSTTDNRVWKEMAKRKMYAVRSEGRMHHGEIQYRKGYRNLEKLYPGRNKLERYTYTGLSHDSFTKRNRDLVARGYTLMWLQCFADTTGEVRYQGLWAKVMEAPPATVSAPAK